MTHARYITFQMAEVAIPWRLFDAILRRIRAASATAASAEDDNLNYFYLETGISF